MFGSRMLARSGLVKATEAYSGFRRQLCGVVEARRQKTAVPRRAMLYLPGSNQKMLSKAAKLKVDCLVLELEDGVAMTAKSDARRNICNYIAKSEKTRSKHLCTELGVRVNSVSSELFIDDIKELAATNILPDAFMIPKVESVDDIAVIYNSFRAAYGDQCIRNSVSLIRQYMPNRLDRTLSDTRLVIWIESAKALNDIGNIFNAAINMAKCGNFFKLDAAVFGSDDFCANIGATRTAEENECTYARQKFVTYCKAYGIQAIDSVYINLDDLDGLKMQCQRGHQWGFDGKQIIHPKQISTVQQAFLPANQKVEWAQGLIKEFDEHSKSGQGAFIYRGQMVDRPLLLQAQNIVQLINAIQKSDIVQKL